MSNTSYTILYVDDDHDDLTLIAEAFEKYTSHLRVTHAHNGYECLQVLRKMHEQESLPCLIILDVNMPVMDGKQCLTKIKSIEEYKEVPVIMFSTSSREKDKTFAKNLGADFIMKPATFSDIEALVKQFVDKCSLQARSLA